MKKLLIIAFVIALIWKFGGANAPVVLGPGIKAPTVPVQTNIKQPQPFEHNGYQIVPLAEFKLTGKVLAREEYSFGRESDLSPVDFAMGWGQMSDESVLQDIEISQSGRWYYWRVEQFPIPRKNIETQSANMHLIPAEAYIENKLDDVKQGQVITFSGYLIRAEAADGWRWQSSLSRDDTGNHACEIVYVNDVQILTP